MTHQLRKPQSRLVIGDVIEFDAIPFGDGEPMFPSDRVPASPHVNPMRRRRLQELRNAVVVPAQALEGSTS